MNNFSKYLLRRVIYLLLTLFFVTTLLFWAFVTISPPEIRALAYMPPYLSFRANPEKLIAKAIQEHGLDDPFPLQYVRWIDDLVQGEWGFSTTMNDEVLDVLLQRTPATMELLLFSLIMFIPLGLVSGVIAGWRSGRSLDVGFRLTAFMATSIPPFILGLMLLAVFYINLSWFPAGRMSTTTSIAVNDSTFKNFTSLLTVDGLLNGRVDISLDALRHLILPAFTLSLVYWATLGRLTRRALIDEMHQDYINTARSKGLEMRAVVWQHAFRNAMIPGLNSIALSVAMFLTNAIVVEIVFGYPGISKPLSRSLSLNYPDIELALGFAIFSILLVIPLMFILDVLQAIADPRIREGVR